jgi:hypothetical protein
MVVVIASSGGTGEVLPWSVCQVLVGEGACPPVPEQREGGRVGMEASRGDHWRTFILNFLPHGDILARVPHCQAGLPPTPLYSCLPRGGKNDLSDWRVSPSREETDRVIQLLPAGDHSLCCSKP